MVRELVAADNVAAAHAVCRDEAAKADPAALIVLDESGITAKLTRTPARALPGALGLDGVAAMMSVAAATSALAFLGPGHESALSARLAGTKPEAKRPGGRACRAVA
jgi:hypothetical protein